MFVLGHLGITVGLAWLITWRWPEVQVDYRLILVAALLPDLIDKPLGALLSLQARLWTHTLIFLAALALLSRLRPLRAFTWLAFGVAVHLTLDMIWFEPNVVLWPLYGWSFPAGTQSLGGYVRTLLTDAYVQFGEIVGASILLLLGWRYRMFSGKAVRKFLRDGRLVEPSPG